ncbi:MAG: DinB family protein [Acidobacteriota bacterium]
MDQWLEDFKHTIESAAPRLLQIGEVESTEPRAEDHWSAKQIIGHLIDSATNNHARFVVGQIKDDLVFAGYEQNEWVQIQHYQEAPWSQLVDLWRAYNLHLLHVMTWAAPDKMHHSCTQHSLQTIAFNTVSDSEPVTLEYLMKDYVVHLKHHLSQILGEGD